MPLTFSAMEDAHAAVLDLGGPNGKSNTFFAVYDGHGGMSLKIGLFVSLIKGNPDLSLSQDRLSLDLRVRMCIDGWSLKIRIKPKITKLPSRRLSWAQMRIF